MVKNSNSKQRNVENLSGKVVSLFFMINSLKDLLEKPQTVMPTKTIAQRYQELREMLNEIQPTMTAMLPPIDPDSVSVEELRIAFQMMFAVSVPFIMDYSQAFENLLKVAHSFMGPSSQGRDFLEPHKQLLFALGLGEEWASAVIFLSMLEIMINEKLIQLGENRGKLNDKSFQDKVKLLSEKGGHKGIEINSLFADSFYRIRSKVLHEGRKPTSDELQKISDFIREFYQSITQIR
ncbi:hypothetical protein Thermo_01414 [Thermoplasmatales archaeon]|nr:hypothetical protein Thermo_01414 [Thermoplasmatales archaeon]